MAKKQRVGKLKVIGIAGINRNGGSAGAGKDSFTDYLVLNRPGLFVRYNFAEPIKKIATDIFGFTHGDVYDPALKEKYNDFWEMSPRRFLQIVGTELFRNRFRVDVWLKLAELRIKSDKEHVFIIPDMRFENEARFVHDMGGKVILIKTDRRSGTKESLHSSEDPLDIKYVDYMVNNNGTLADLKIEADRIYSKLFKGADNGRNSA